MKIIKKLLCIKRYKEKIKHLENDIEVLQEKIRIIKIEKDYYLEQCAKLKVKLESEKTND